MRSWTTSAALGMLVAAGTLASAGTVKLGNPAWGRNGNGGEFRVYSTTGNVGLSGLAADAAYTGAQAGSWGTFCIELAENLNLNTTYNTTIAKWAVNGSTLVNPANPNQAAATLAGGDALEYETAFLYNAFRKGLLDDYQIAAEAGAYGAALDALATAAGAFDYSASAARASDTEQLQFALWKFEENRTIGAGNAMGLFLHALALHHVAAGGDWFGRGLGSVRVLNLTHQTTGGNIQSQLTIIPLPTAGGMALAGLLGVLAIRRRVRL